MPPLSNTPVKRAKEQHYHSWTTGTASINDWSGEVGSNFHECQLRTRDDS